MKRFKEKLVAYFAVLNILVFISIRYVHSGLIDTFGGSEWVLLIFALLLLATLALSVANLFYKKLPLTITVLTLSSLFLIVHLTIFLMTIDYTIYFVRNFSRLFFIVGTFYLLGFTLHYALKRPNRAQLTVKVHVGLLIASVLFGTVKTFDLGFMRFISKPVVYAVKDEYQIVFETSRKGSGELEINGVTYYETASGGVKTSSKVHKITVPMALLDTYKTYEVRATNYIYRGPYNAIKGRTIKEKITFRPLDSTDGITFHVATDFHDKSKSRIRSVSYEKDKLDFIILAGDISSFLETRKNISFINKTAHAITKGEIAVIYNRGNHETKGIYREELSDAVGTDNGNFYYSVELGGIYFIVLDLGEDHHDNWWEFYGTAKYTEYRAKQIQWLEEIALDINNEYNLAAFDYHFVISHQPLSAVNKDRVGNVFEEEKEAMVALLNTMNIDASFAGHFHNLYYLYDLPNTELTCLPEFDEKQFAKGTGATFPEFVTSKHALSQEEKNQRWFEAYTSLRVELIGGNKKAYFVNSKQQIVQIKNPFTGLFEEKVIYF